MDLKFARSTIQHSTVVHPVDFLMAAKDALSTVIRPQGQVERTFDCFFSFLFIPAC